MPGRRVRVLRRMGFKELFLEGHIVLRLIGKALAVPIDHAGPWKGLFHDGQAGGGFVGHHQGGGPPCIMHEARARTQCQSRLQGIPLVQGVTGTPFRVGRRRQVPLT